ncbi:hypothetical protein JW960_25570 [candidate division KSB1 bacterium]|nr:hypothetical protein [candidate division KSB1 bacterium]
MALDRLFQQKTNGFSPDINQTKKQGFESQFYTFREFNQLIYTLKQTYPHLLHVEQIGSGSVKGLPIWALKISDNPEQRENEPAVLFTSIHHAKELLGGQLCMYLLQYFLQGYEKDERIKKWVDDNAIWMVPILNPDGYELVMDEDRSPQFWRKNLRDNNGNGKFDPRIDGVDINRNYDFNWDDESDNDPRSWYYRGPYPFSEKETQAIRDLALRERFAIHLDFHSYGEVILYPWDNFTPPPDKNLIIDLATNIAKQVRRNRSIDHYAIRPLNGRLGQSSVWMRGRAGVLSFIVEVGDSHVPKAWQVSNITESCANTAFYVLDRLYYSAIKGVVRNAYNKRPILAEIEFDRYASSVVENPYSDSETGFYFRIAEAGKYKITFSAPGFRSKIVHDVIVDSDKITTLNVELFPIEEMYPSAN